MQIVDTSQTHLASFDVRATCLLAVKPGRVVRYNDMEGKPAYYLIPKWSKLEASQLTVPEGKRMLVNLETGRVVFKNENLLVYLTSCSAEAYLRNV